ncbi:MAG: dolichol kinase [Ignavibacteriales bacterium]|nr:dolichol kinase [Ignavibacteriales bacterium]
MEAGLSNIDGSYRVEIARKAIHFCSLLIPILYFFVNKENALLLLVPVTIIFIGVDVARYYSQPLQQWFLQLFGWLLRKHETDTKRKRLNGASYVLISATICVIVFPKLITLSCFSVLIISDLTAALVGKRFGRHRFFSKSLEGSLAFLFSGIIVILLTPKVEYHLTEYLIGVIAVGIGMIVEALPISVDDNLSIPLTVGVTMWLLYFLFLPSSNIYIL